MVAGDLLQWLESADARSGDVFFYPGTVVSCLLRQYRDGLDLLLQRLGKERVRIVTPALDSWISLLGLPLTIRLQAVQVAGDTLLRALCRIRPYERNAGESDAVYATCLDMLSKAAEAGTHFETLETIADRLNAVERYVAKRPVVGVAGDIYTRINGFASDRLFEKLEAAEFEIWPAPYGTDVAALNATRRKRESWKLIRPRAGLRYTMATRTMARQTRRIEKIFSRIEGMRPEPEIDAIEKIIAPYLGTAANPLMVLNIGRMLMYAKAGASGILNAACINCMVGAASDAFTERLKQDIGAVPLTTFVFGGSNGSANQTRLEAFIHQVKQFDRLKNG
jgi:hypothetical protein